MIFGKRREKHKGQFSKVQQSSTKAKVVFLQPALFKARFTAPKDATPTGRAMAEAGVTMTVGTLDSLPPLESSPCLERNVEPLAESAPRLDHSYTIDMSPLCLPDTRGQALNWLPIRLPGRIWIDSLVGSRQAPNRLFPSRVPVPHFWVLSKRSFLAFTHTKSHFGHH